MEVIEELAQFVDSHTPGDTVRLRRHGARSSRSRSTPIDYRQEASHLRTLGSWSPADHPALLVPGPVDGYTTARVLTMDLVEGQNVGSLGR